MGKEKEQDFLKEMQKTLEKSGLVPAVLGLIKELIRIVFKPGVWQEKKNVVE